MGYKSTLIKLAINQSPKKIILWLANKKARGVARITDFHFSSTQHKLYVQMIFKGEQELVELWIEDFTLVQDGESYKLVIRRALSTRPWIDSFIKNFALNRELKIPEKYAELVNQLLKYEGSSANES